MTARLWYLRRGVAWLPVLGGCGGAAVVAVLMVRWPGAVGLLAPAVLACCLAATAFTYDEDALPVVAVTPRGARWRRTSRFAVSLLPSAVWAAVVAVRPGHVPLLRAWWWLLGGAAVLLVVGTAALASRRQVAAPGQVLAPAVALSALAPVTVAGMFRWGSLYPVGDFPAPVRMVWSVVALGGALLTALALRPGIRP